MAMQVTRWLRLLVVLGTLLLTGCIQYDLDLKFDSQTHGQVVQRLHWVGGAATAPELRQDWQQALAARSRQVGGRLRSPSPDTLEIIVPFNNGGDLAHRFNQFFGSEGTGTPLTLPSGEPVSAHIDLTQGNWIVAIYTHLTLSLDLRAVPDGATLPASRLQSVRWLTGQVSFTTPWGLRWAQTSQGTEAETEGTEKIAETNGGNQPPESNPWPLIPGQINTYEAGFWVPSPIGIGAIAIALFVTMGYGFKYRDRR
ncbi:DUF3153 domain-containing protein [Leptolyngbya sp. PCC 6406]|uniref:DUF3153 domain-containing protein n=1 Tax=Leptolyngbya sp. PCC 6406 TaxID=1173264 RepID=UPI0002E65063|nr:DUF3153 domain-containing protein [Leptolyngbya sp. PCC 6406]